ncbi:MAG: glycoside hydrolase family 38 C-terminal domain-containing protein, partial [Planctomycetota bacterium]
WLAREGASEALERYFRNLRFGSYFVDLLGEEEQERQLFHRLLAGDRAGFQKLVQERLAEFKVRGKSLKKDQVFFIGESHINLEWLWPWRETVNICRDTYGQALEFMETYPEFRFTQGIAQSYLWMKDSYPPLFEKIRKRVASGQWELVGGAWTEPDYNMPVGESQVRQILFGQRFFQKEFGRTVSVGWSPDSFGYCHQLPQILRSAGMDAFFTTKMLWNDTTPFPYYLFQWTSPDGSSVLACTPPQGIGSRVRPDLLKGLLDKMEQRHGVRMVLVPFGVGDHGGGPSRQDIDMIRALQETDLAPTVRMSTIAEFLEAVRTREDVRIPHLDDELYLQYHRGTYTSQSKIKWFNRKGEVLLFTAERFLALASAKGMPLPRETLREMWRRVLLHQCHDGLPGTSIGEVKKDISDDYAWVLPTGEQVLQDSLKALAETINTTGPGEPLVVFNPLPWVRLGVVEIPWQDTAIVGPRGYSQETTQRTHDGKLLFTALLPGLGYSVFHLLPEEQVPHARPPVPRVKVDGWVLENQHLRMEINPDTGNLKSVKLRRGSEEILDGEGNLLELYQDRPRQWDAWNLGLSERQVLGKPTRVEIIERGPVRAVVRVERSFNRSRMSQDIVLYGRKPWIEFHTWVDWHEDHKLLRAAFPLSHWGKQATYHVPFGAQERPAEAKTEAEKAMFEVPGIYWADQSAGGIGAAIFNDCKYGYSASGKWLRLSLLKAATWPDPDQDQGEHRFSYAFFPHKRDWKAAQVMFRGTSFNYPVHTLSVPAKEGPREARASLLQVAFQKGDSLYTDQASGIMLTAVKPAEEGEGIIVRVCEFLGRRGTVLLTFDRELGLCQRADLLERPQGAVVVEANKVEFPIGAHRIETVRVNFLED